MAGYTYAKFNDGDQKTRAQSVYQYDYGRRLQVEGLKLPTAVEVHFAVAKDAESVTRVGTTKDGVTVVTIPDSVLENEGVTLNYTVYAWIFITDDTSGYTEYEITIPVQTRAKPEGSGTAEDEDLFREAIAAVNEAAENAVSAKNAASESAAAAKTSEQNASASAEAAAGSATEAAAAAKAVTEAGGKAVEEIESYTSEKKTEITGHTDTEIARADTAMQAAKDELAETIQSADQSNAELTETISDAKSVSGDIAQVVEEAKTATTAAESQTEAAKTATDEAEKQAAAAKQAVEALFKAQIDLEYKEKVAAATSKEEVDALFAEWWMIQYDAELFTKVEMLERWFGNVLVDTRVHGVTTPRYAKSTSMLGELTDDSAGLVCTPSTESTAGSDPFAHLPQFWCLEVSAEKNTDGSHTIYYVEHIDDTADVRSGEHLCWMLQKNTYKREWQDSEYKYLKTRCTPAPGYKRWPEGTDRTGTVHEYMAHPKYYAGLDEDGAITCGTGLKPANRTSHQTGITKWRARGSQYSGGSGSLPKFLDAMMRLKYARKGNSGKIEGCTSYNYQYTVAISETGVERVILTTAQAANLFVGSAVMLGVQSGTDRNTASNYSIFDAKLITAIETVNIDGTDYSAVYVDNGGKTFDTTAGSTYLSTSPYYSGWNDNVLGRDGSRYSPTSGKEPGMIQGVEFMNGSYLIVSDELWQWSTDTDGNYNFDCYKCYDQSKVGTSVNENYERITGAHLIYPAGTTSAWVYIADNIIDNDVLWPEATTASGSGVGLGAGFYRYPASSGVRAAWCFGSLINGGNAGVACHSSNGSVGGAYWDGSLGAPGSEG